MQTAGFVLVGGHSSRMGQDKALLRGRSGVPLVLEIAGTVENVAGSVVLIGKPDQYGNLGIPCLPDLRNSMGPLAGIEAALAADRGELNVIVGCDMPGLQERWLVDLLEASHRNGTLCTVARDSEGKLHPLLGVYRRGCLPHVRAALDGGRLRLMDAVIELGAATLDIEEMIWNVNTQSEWRDWVSGTDAV